MLREIEQLIMHGRPRQRFIIPGVLPTGPCFLYGQSGSGKTGIAIRTALSVAGGLAWADQPVDAGGVIYVAGEDEYGAWERLVACARALQLDIEKLPLSVRQAPAGGLVAESCAAELITAAAALSGETNAPVRLIVVDTLGACFGDESQDDARYGTRVTGNLDRIAQSLQCCVLVLHHPGKRSEGMRGSQVLKDRADAVIKAWRGNGGDTFLEIEKMRNERGGALRFSIGTEQLITDHDAFPVQVVKVVRVAERGPEQTKEEAQEQRKQTDAATALGILVKMATNGQASREAWKAACFEAWKSKPTDGSRKTAFTNAVKKLQADGSVQVAGDIVSVRGSGDAADQLAA